MNLSEELGKRRVPCMAAFVSPFRDRERGRFRPVETHHRGREQAALGHAELHRLVLGFPAPYHMVVARDGGDRTSGAAADQGHHLATEQFNPRFAALLVGGVYCEAINPDGLEFGFVVDWKDLRLQSGSQAAAFERRAAAAQIATGRSPGATSERRLLIRMPPRSRLSSTNGDDTKST